MNFRSMLAEVAFVFAIGSVGWVSNVACAADSSGSGPLLPPRAPAISRVKPKVIDWKKEVIYFLLVDRFADGNPRNNTAGNPASYKKFDGSIQNEEALKFYQGGDLEGVISKLDYIKDLGATAIWLSPLYENDDKDFLGWWPYHGYHPTDHFKVENHFGNMKLVKRLVDEAHARGLKVILDTVYNQVGPNHPWVKNTREWETKGFKYWFHPRSGKDGSTSIINWEDQSELENKELFGLPDFNQDNEHVYRYLLDMSEYWIENTGADGFRLDAVKHVSQKFWSRINGDLHKKYGKDFLMIGEVLHGDPKYLARYQNDGFNALFDIPLYFDIRRVFAEGNSMEVLSNRILEEARVYNSPDMIWSTLIDNHDLVRFSYAAKDNVKEKIKNALSFVAAFNGLPVIYYGTEVALEGGAATNSKGEGTDYLNRRFMPWERVEAEKKRGGLIDYMKSLFEFRKKTVSLYNGRFLELYKDACVYVFAKFAAEDMSLAAFNNCAEKRRVLAPVRYGFVEDGEAFTHFRGESAIKTERDRLVFELDGFSSSLYSRVNGNGYALPSNYRMEVAASESIGVGFTSVNFAFVPPVSLADVHSVSVAGDFNGWNPGTHQMRKSVDGTRWELRVPVRRGRHPYKFVVNGKDWIEDPSAKIFENDGVGGRNSVLEIP